MVCSLAGCLVERTKWYRNVINEQEFEPPEALNFEIEPYEFDPYEDELPAAADPEGMRGVNTRYPSTISIFVNCNLSYTFKEKF